MEKIFKKINLFMGMISLLSLSGIIIPFVHLGIKDLNLKDFIFGTITTETNYFWIIFIIFPTMILILHLLEHLDKKVSHQDLVYSILMIITSIIFFFIKREYILIGFYIYAISSFILFIFSLIRYFAFKRMG